MWLFPALTHRLLRLSVNTSKSQLLLLARRGFPGHTVSGISWCNIPIPQVKQATCLGVTLQSDLSWSAHLANLRKKLNGVCFCIHRLRRLGFARSLLLSVFRQLFLSTFTYCISVWGSAALSLISSLRICQKNAFRAVIVLPARSSVSARLRTVALNVSELYRYRMACIAFLSFHRRASSLTISRRPSFSARRHTELNLLVLPFDSEFARFRRFKRTLRLLHCKL